MVMSINYNLLLEFRISWVKICLFSGSGYKSMPLNDNKIIQFLIYYSLIILISEKNSLCHTVGT